MSVRAFDWKEGRGGASRSSSAIAGASLALLVLAVGIDVVRADIPNGRQISATRLGTRNNNQWRIWAIEQGGGVATVQQDSSPWTWTQRGNGGSTASRGITAVWWVDGTGHHERAYYVGASGSLFEYAIVDGASPTWTEIVPPSGETLTGYVAGLTGIWDGGPYRYTVVAATTTDGDFYIAIRNVTTDGSWIWSRKATAYHTSLPLATSKNPAEDIWSFLGSKSDDTLGMVRWDPATGWDAYDQGSPGVGVCRSIAAAQAQLSSSTYRLYVFCTATDTNEDRVRIAYGTSETDTSLSWFSLTLPDSQPVDRSGNSLAATSRPDNDDETEYAIDGYCLGEGDDHLYRLKRTTSGWSVQDLGDAGPGELIFTDGGMVALEENPRTLQGPTSRGVFVGGIGSGIGYLYARSDDLVPRPWEALGGGRPLHDVSGDDLPRAESMISEWQGKMLAAAMIRPDPPDDAYVQAFWSNTDGYTWSGPVTLPDNGFQYYADPTVAFTDAGKAYVTMTGVDFADIDGDGEGDCDPAAGLVGSEAHFVTTTDGTTYSAPVTIAASPTLIDHPWMGIDRSRSPNRLHFAWLRLDTDTLEYRYYDDGVGFGPVETLSTDGGPPTLTVGADGGVFVAWIDAGSVRVCKLSADFTGCDATPYVLTGDWDVDVAPLPLPGGEHIRATHSWSIRASRANSNKLYYGFQRTEADGDHKDIYVSVGTYDETAKTWSWSTPEEARTPVDDDIDQFNPALNVTWSGGVTESVHASWYDRDESCSGGSNYCIRRKRSWSERAHSFLYLNSSQQGELTDPALLPLHCRDESQRFIGDFQEGEGVSLHSHHIWSHAPISSPSVTARLEQGLLSAGAHVY